MTHLISEFDQTSEEAIRFLFKYSAFKAEQEADMYLQLTDPFIKQPPCWTQQAKAQFKQAIERIPLWAGLIIRFKLFIDTSEE